MPKMASGINLPPGSSLKQWTGNWIFPRGYFSFVFLVFLWYPQIYDTKQYRQISHGKKRQNIGIITKKKSLISA
jgi:hypothetical protein